MFNYGSSFVSALNSLTSIIGALSSLLLVLLECSYRLIECRLKGNWVLGVAAVLSSYFEFKMLMGTIFLWYFLMLFLRRSRRFCLKEARLVLLVG